MRDRTMNETELERVRELVRISGEMIDGGSVDWAGIVWLVGIIEELGELLGVTK